MGFFIAIIVSCIIGWFVLKPLVQLIVGYVALRRNPIASGKTYLKEHLRKTASINPDLICDEAYQQIARLAYNVADVTHDVKHQPLFGAYVGGLDFYVEQIEIVMSGKGTDSEKLVADILAKYGIPIRQNDSKQYVTTVNEVALFVQALDETERAWLLFCAQEFRRKVTGGLPQVNETLLRPADFSVGDCVTIYQQMEGLHAKATEQSQQSVARFAERGDLGIAGDRFKRELELQRYAMRLWMATLAARIHPDCIELIRATWATLIGVADETILKAEQRERIRQQISVTSNFPPRASVSPQEAIKDIRITPKF